MAKSKRNLSRKRRRNTKKRTRGKTRIVRRIHKIIGGLTLENLKDIYDPEWNMERKDETAMEKAFYKKQRWMLGDHYRNVLIDGDENKGYSFVDIGNNAYEILGKNELNNDSKMLSTTEMERRINAGISIEPLIDQKEIKDLYNYLQNQISQLRSKILKNQQVVSEEPV